MGKLVYFLQDGGGLPTPSEKTLGKRDTKTRALKFLKNLFKNTEWFQWFVNQQHILSDLKYFCIACHQSYTCP